MGSETGGSPPVSSYWRDVAWQLSGASLAQIVGIAGIPVLTRLYTPTDFAAQSLFLQLVTYATALVTWRFEYFIQLPKSDDDVRALNRLVLSLGCIAVLACTPLFWAFRKGLAAQVGNSDVAPWLILVPLTAVLFSWAVAAQNNAQRLADFITSGFSELVGKLAYVSAGILGAFMLPGAAGLIITTAIAAIGKLGFVFLRRPTWARHRQRSDAGAVRHVRRRYGVLATSTVVSHVLSTSAFAIPQVAIARLYGVEVLGQFALVLATVFLPSGLVSAAVGNVYYQRGAKQWAEGHEFESLWRETLYKLVLIGLPAYALVVFFAEFGYPLVFGQQWVLAGEFAAWMAVAAFASFVSGPMDRSCLIVGAGSYSILWSVYRLGSTAVIIWLAIVLEFSAPSFVKAFVIHMCIALGIDLWMSRRFSQGRLGVFA